MKPRSILANGVLIHAWLVSGTLLAQSSPVAPPAQVSADLCRPAFVTAEGRFAAGTAFVARLHTQERTQTFLVTAHHLFGPDGGLPRQVGWKDLPTFVRSVRCARLASPGLTLSAGRPLPIRDARPYSEDGAVGDVAVFRLQDAKVSGLELRKAEPTPKQRVWLAARVAGGEPPGKLLHGATLVAMDRDWIEFAYDNPKLDLKATSGAPIVDEEGRVVGINIGAKTEDKKLIGVAQSAAVVLGAVEKAVAAAAQSGVAADAATPRR